MSICLAIEQILSRENCQAAIVIALQQAGVGKMVE
jgi:hypothetical protein